MQLTVLNVAYPLAPVGPNAVGGAEQILTQIDAALVRAGHRSIVIACEGSVAAGELVRTPRMTGELTDVVRRRAQQQHLRAIERVLEHEPIDIVHMHGIDFHEYLPRPGVPVLVTLHLPPSWYPPEIFYRPRPQTYLHCVSAAQRRACPPCASPLPHIENGVPTDVLRPRHCKRQFAVALGRICPEKGFHFALEATRRAGMPLLLAGEVFPYQQHQRYFRAEILPRLTTDRRFIGAIGLKRKRRLLAAACCLLVPSLVPETSSLVAMEALACGTPVIAFSSGALPEIIEHGRTGFLVRDEHEMAEAIRNLDAIDPRACREVAETRFSAERMCGQYLDLYEQIAAGQRGDVEIRETVGMTAESL